mmetsp:Transcript_15834/g.40186  ORF Transcript_15834/g.40186 Transcript_15834/m.40186 type:complete len:419 (+) Transcript_15834:1475-2731(+)
MLSPHCRFPVWVGIVLVDVVCFCLGRRYRRRLVVIAAAAAVVVHHCHQVFLDAQPLRREQLVSALHGHFAEHVAGHGCLCHRSTPALMKCTNQKFILLLIRQRVEPHSISAHSDCEIWVPFRMEPCILQNGTIQYINIDVMAVGFKVPVEERHQICFTAPGVGASSKCRGHQAKGVGNAIQAAGDVWKLRHAHQRGQHARSISFVHWICTWSKRFASLASIWSCRSGLAIHNVACNCQDRERRRRVPVHSVLVQRQRFHESADNFHSNVINARVVISKRGEITGDSEVIRQAGGVTSCDKHTSMFDCAQRIRHDTQTGNSKSHEASNRSVMKCHLKRFVVRLVVRTVDSTHSVDIYPCHERHGNVEEKVVNHIVRKRLIMRRRLCERHGFRMLRELWTQRGISNLVASSIQRQEKRLC